MQLVVPKAKEVSVGTVTDLAVARGLPARLLRKRLVNTSAALDCAGSQVLTEAETAFQRKARSEPYSRLRAYHAAFATRMICKKEGSGVSRAEVALRHPPNSKRRVRKIGSESCCESRDLERTGRKLSSISTTALSVSGVPLAQR